MALNSAPCQGHPASKFDVFQKLKDPPEDWRYGRAEENGQLWVRLYLTFF